MNRGTYYLRIISLGAISLTVWSCSAEKKVSRYDYLITHQRPRPVPSTYTKPVPVEDAYSSPTNYTTPSTSNYSGNSYASNSTFTGNSYTSQSGGAVSADLNTFDHAELFPDENYAAALEEGSANALNSVIKEAKSYLGTPYVYGGMSGSGMDCSGLICLSYKAVGKNLPRTSREMASRSKKIPKRKIKKGDLLFFSAKNTGRIDHVALVTSVRNGEISFIHATSSRGVRTDVLSDDYWSKRFQHAGRP